MASDRLVRADFEIGKKFSISALNTLKIRFHTPPWPFGGEYEFMSGDAKNAR
jgi:hypothetical protein